MFPFSSLFAQVPLIILAAAYMLYFGAYAIGKSKEIIPDDQPEPKEQSVIIIPLSESGKTFYYNNEQELTQIILTSGDCTVKYTRSYISLLYIDPDRRICSSFNSFSLFSRPPPARG